MTRALKKSFQIEYVSASFDNASLQDGPGLAYTDANNKSLAWAADEAGYFNANIQEGYKPSVVGRAQGCGRSAENRAGGFGTRIFGKYQGNCYRF
jgi:hypothetical protein